MNILEMLEKRDLKTDLPALQAGNTVRVHLRVVEGKKERIQVFEGVVIGLKGNRARRSMTVRKISNGVGVERVFPLNSPIIERIEVMQRGKVRRAKLHYLRDLSGKAARLHEISREKQEKADKKEEPSE
ncbi:MAG: 50S ribosomal protein L19 [bacterium]